MLIRTRGMLDGDKLSRHVKRLCRKNLKLARVKCCAECPFEPIILDYYPELAKLFEIKRTT